MKLGTLPLDGPEKLQFKYEVHEMFIGIIFWGVVSMLTRYNKYLIVLGLLSWYR